ncbi:unnamed protein product [Brachionus calyciflorus]|uniref:Anoctamin n=1 Tax=Brachionus calyciflorus TaxID=104777 RepID=A0A813W2N8_9BILA|nr:unnamed protein product [Brachionus calyciflorus]
MQMSDISENSSNVPKPKPDFVLVYSNSKLNSEQNQEKEIFLNNLRTNGLELDEWASPDSKDVYVLIRTPDELLFKTAERTKLKLPIKNNDLVEEGIIIKSFKKILCFPTLPSDVALENENNFFTMSYTSKYHEKFLPYLKTNEQINFSEKDRINLTYEILSRTSAESGKKFDNKQSVGIECLLKKGVFIDAFPLHDKVDTDKFVDSNVALNDREKLWKYWVNWKNLFTLQPLNLIRRYFGEKVAFYFAWLGFYTGSLFLLSIFGILTLVYGLITYEFDIPSRDICNKNRTNIFLCPLCDDVNCKTVSINDYCVYSKFNYIFDNPSIIIFSFIISAWSVFNIELWKRRQNSFQFEWDTYDLDNNLEPSRPDFALKTKKKRISPITLTEVPYYPIYLKATKYLLSGIVVIFIASIVLTYIIGIVFYRTVLNVVFNKIDDDTRKLSTIVVPVTAAIINFSIILITGKIYEKIARFLTDFELHETNSQYEAALTIKMFLFEFVNIYGSLFYIAFFKGRNISFKILDYDLKEQCHPAGCFIDLTIQLAIFMAGKQIWNNIVEIALPFIKNKIFKVANKIRNIDKQWENDKYLEKWDQLTLFKEYQEMVIQYGFISMFIVSFPLGPLFCLLNNLAEIRIDAQKILKTMQRPVPKKAKDIGVWLPIIKAVTKAGVITNAFLIAFTSEFIPKFLYQFVFNYGNGTLEGYLDYSLSYKNLTDFGFVNATNEICRYKDFREPYNSSNKYEFTKDFYIILCARLVFVVVFEHLVFALVSFVDFLIPDVPLSVQDQIQREAFIVQETIWEAKSEQIHKNLKESETSESRASENFFKQFDFFDQIA